MTTQPAPDHDPDLPASVRDDFIVHLAARALRPTTIVSYASHARRYARWCAAQERPIIGATRSQVNAHIASLATKHTGSYLNVRISALKALYRWLHQSGQIPEDPSVELRQRRWQGVGRLPYSVDELRALLDAADVPHVRAILLFLMGSGVRRSELLNMKIANIDWTRGRVLIDGKGSRQRHVAPGRAAFAALREHVGGRKEGPVWRIPPANRPLSKSGIKRILDTLAARAGVPKVEPHRFRATMITSLLDSGVDLIAVATVAGHANLETTRVYQRATEAKRALRAQAQYSLADRLGAGPPPRARRG